VWFLKASSSPLRAAKWRMSMNGIRPEYPPKKITVIDAIYVIVFMGACGWVVNIVKMGASFDEPICALLIWRAVGIFLPPLGAILGYL
jgi:hypothetical protein